MHLFGSHTFSMINADNERIWVKFYFRTQQGIENLTDQEAAAIVADDRESHGRDLLEAIDSGNFPRWTLSIQVMTDQQARTHKHNPFDVTKVWPKADYPLIEGGVMELNRYPDNYFAEVEQAAFSPANIVPGISFSPGQDVAGPPVGNHRAWHAETSARSAELCHSVFLPSAPSSRARGTTISEFSSLNQRDIHVVFSRQRLFQRERQMQTAEAAFAADPLFDEPADPLVDLALNRTKPVVEKVTSSRPQAARNQAS